jgi:hypothetical protein
MALAGGVGTAFTPIGAPADQPLSPIDWVVNWPSLLLVKSDLFVLLMIIPTAVVNALGWFFAGLFLCMLASWLRLIFVGDRA